MITSAGDERITDVRSTDDELVVTLADRRTFSVPLAWYPRLLNASAEQRSNWRLIGDGLGIHWPELDEDLSAAGLLGRVPAPAAVRAAGTERAMSEENKALARRGWEEVVNEKNLDALEEFYAPDVVWHELAQDIQGLEQARQFASTFFEAFPDIRITVEDMIAEGDKVVTRYTIRGTHKGEFFGVPPTDRQIALEGITIHRFAGGKIVEEWERYDNLGLLQQLGLAPEGGQAESS
jgi:steroid delta-isomerase-like uncharacterized protein